LSATVSVDYCRAWTQVELKLQPPDREMQIPTRVLLDPSSGPAGSSRVEHHDGEQTVQLVVRTYDWYHRTGGLSVSEGFTPAMAAAEQLVSKPSGFVKGTACPFPSMGQAELPGVERNEVTKSLVFSVSVESASASARSFFCRLT
jgi:hypothetical protein